jgi:hypothetical protein
MLRIALLIALFVILSPWRVLADNTELYRQWVEEMKTAERGPFLRLRWFCNDGTVLPPKAYACANHGGGHQHGEWSERTSELRDQGYKVANLLAGIDPEELAAQPGFLDTYGQMLVERFLISADDGWIMRRALFYRGAIQEEDEREGGRALLEHLAGQDEWIGPRFAALRIGVRLLPHGEAQASAQQVRQESAALSDRDRGFMEIRAKIHGAPDAGDASRVREYAAGVGDASLRARYEALADLIDQVYQPEPLTDVLEANAKVFSGGPWLQKILRDAAAELLVDGSASNRFRVTAGLLADLRESMPRIRSAGARLRVLDLTLRLEDEHFRAGAELRKTLDGMTRAQRLALLGHASEAAYGIGLVKAREHKALMASLDRLASGEVALQTYLDELRYLGRMPGWGTQNLRFFFFESMQKLAEIEPKSMLFIQDQLRGSPLLFFAQGLDGLSQDGNRLAGVRHRIFGEEVGVGFQALNPGIASGTFHSQVDLDEVESLKSDGIYLLPETVSDLPANCWHLDRGRGQSTVTCPASGA